RAHREQFIVGGTVQRDRSDRMSPPVVVAIVPHHRGPALLERCVASLLESEGITLQVVLVWNACPEPPPPAAAGSPRVHIVRAERPLGFSAANNLGTRWARSNLTAPDYYLFANNDTEFEPDAVALLVRALEAGPRRAIAGPRIMILGAPDCLNSLGLNVTILGDAWDEGIGRSLAEYGPLPPARPVLAVTGSALLARAPLVEELEGWSEIYDYYYEDVDLCLRARRLGWEVVHEPRALVRHALSSTAGSGSDFHLVRTWRSRILLLAVHWPAGLLLRLAPALIVWELKNFVWSLLRAEKKQARLRVKAWGGALRSLPEALRRRRRLRGGAAWVAMLRPARSVPAIRLPRIGAPARAGSAP
ncbi:MAG: glycosyltransferase family 2 protein, partial [Thermoanaerobaculia bacterium]